jgi:hypothetical protein
VIDLTGRPSHFVSFWNTKRTPPPLSLSLFGKFDISLLFRPLLHYMHSLAHSSLPLIHRISLNGFNLDGETVIHRSIGEFLYQLSASLRIPYDVEMLRTPGFNGLVNTDQAGELLRLQPLVRVFLLLFFSVPILLSLLFTSLFSFPSLLFLSRAHTSFVSRVIPVVLRYLMLTKTKRCRRR